MEDFEKKKSIEQLFSEWRQLQRTAEAANAALMSFEAYLTPPEMGFLRDKLAEEVKELEEKRKKE